MRCRSTSVLWPVVLAAILAMVVGCGDDGRRSPESAIASVVRISTQRCDEPKTFAGYGIDVGGHIVTAAHLVDGELHDVRVDGAAARVLAIDHRADLAVLDAPDAATVPARSGRKLPAVVPHETAWMIAGAGDLAQGLDEGTDTDGRPADTGVDSSQPATSNDSDRLQVAPVHVERETRLVVTDVSSGDTFERNAVVFTPGVSRGASGAALVNAGGELIGVVVLSSRARDQGYAVRVDEITDLLERPFPADTGSEATLCERW